MYWKMIWRFTVLIFIFTFLAPIPFSIVEGYLRSAGREVPIWLFLGKTLAGLLAIGTVFTLLANSYHERILAYCQSKGLGEINSISPNYYSSVAVQTNSSWTIINHAIFVVLFTWLCSLPLNVILLDRPLLEWAYSIIPITSMAFLGLLIGFALHRRRENAASRRQPSSVM